MLQPEAEWIAKAQKGDDEAFSRLVEVFQRPVHNLCYRMLGNANDAEDAAQETFIRAYKAIKRYDPSRKFSTWLLTIASNYCIDQHRRRKLPTFSYDSMPVPDISDNNPGIDRLMVLGENKEKVMELLDILNPKDRSAVILRYWYDYSYDEIANSLSLSNSAVKSRLHRARKELASEWLEMQEESTTFERTQNEQTI
ncbi:MAG: sigma-70 family RNA polymerase sigma factor [Chloroflexi bacterium]|nr:sigma-70 family RNA polymerase sigma factor [Chloroflexota bacterium]MBT3669904.1 sigma-70 family RNA polymerase sigma factor [Chloroflexota bacterium]MBT4001977.1 sigma-70 family RNA polymerase sigma factor [Chloroflexota bacterium]MBT4304806.1 sigma-70 family RNA polymerase sigma factor [Chloroflexota bacterium]MBT4534693.1 sigma-70 family RNA polymerase sigma factor [Chloroflexota bacterium]